MPQRSTRCTRFRSSASAPWGRQRGRRAGRAGDRAHAHTPANAPSLLLLLLALLPTCTCSWHGRPGAAHACGWRAWFAALPCRPSPPPAARPCCPCTAPKVLGCTPCSPACSQQPTHSCTTPAQVRAQMERHQMVFCDAEPQHPSREEAVAWQHWQAVQDAWLVEAQHRCAAHTPARTRKPLHARSRAPLALRGSDPRVCRPPLMRPCCPLSCTDAAPTPSCSWRGWQHPPRTTHSKPSTPRCTPAATSGGAPHARVGVCAGYAVITKTLIPTRAQPAGASWWLCMHRGTCMGHKPQHLQPNCTAVHGAHDGVRKAARCRPPPHRADTTLN